MSMDGGVAPGARAPRGRAARPPAGGVPLGLATWGCDPGVDGMRARVRERAKAVQERPLPPVAGPQREQFLAQAQLDFQDFAIVGDATRESAAGRLPLRIDRNA